jgi:hypothetical protein
MLTRIFSLWQLHTTVQFQLYLRLHNVIINQLRRQVQVSEYFMVLVMTVVYQFQWKLILPLHPPPNTQQSAGNLSMIFCQWKLISA